MTAVPQKVLNWLYSVLTSEYHDVNRTYNDVAHTLSSHSSFSPRTDVYTFENGASALLLHISGTLPVSFRGRIYRFPIDLWIPHAYPREAPVVYVTPTQGMVVRPGQHVSGDGRVYHPYLARWHEFWDKSNLVDFLSVMSGVFAKEPPLVAKQQLEQPTSQQASMPPPVPPLPPELDKPSSERYDAPSKTAAHLGSPPPPPPKPYGHPTERSQSQIYTPHNGGEHRAAGPPPLPQKPTDHKGGSEAISSPRMYKPSDQSNFHAEKYPPQSPTNHSGNVSLSQPHPSLSHLHASPNASEPFGPVSAIASGAQMEAMYPGRQHAFHQQQVSHHGRPLSQSQFQSVLPPGYASHMPSQQASYGQSSLPPPNQPDPNQYLSHSPHHQPPQQWPPALMPGNMTAPSPPKSRPAPPAEDILSLPTLPSDSLPAPPIPPNPEKDSLLRTFSQSLHAQREEAASRNASTLPSLRAQHSALLNSTSALQQELRALETLEGQLTSNERILAECTRAADKVMAETRDRQPPGVDEVLVAPTVVGGQLYEVVAEQRALSDALVALQRALDRSRVSAEVFAKQTRTLARERFLKLALERKIAQGMGLMLER